MRGILGWVALAAMAALVAGCGGPYADAKRYQDQHLKAMEAYIADLEKAQDAKAVARAINTFADRMERLAPEARRLAEKHPELRKSGATPEELKEGEAQMKELAPKMAGAMMKVMPHMGDPEVRKAQERLMKVMQSFSAER